MRVLIAEDDASVRHLLKKNLLRAGYDVLEATDGRAALECLFECRWPAAGASGLAHAGA